MSLKRLIASIILGLSLAGCSGGGGGSDSSVSGGGVINTAPSVAQANTNQTGFQGYEFSYDASQSGGTFADADGDAISYAVEIVPANAGLTATGATISGTPNQLGDITATITATDINGASSQDSFTITVDANQAAISSTFGGAVDLTNLANYADPEVPDYFGRAIDNGNPVTDAGATLGRVLFYDVAMSIDDTLSCSSCHQQALAFGDAAIVSSGVQGGETRRHSMRLVNVLYHNDEENTADITNMFWDERADSAEDQATMPLHEHDEHGWSGQNGRPDIDDLITKLEAIDYYEELFRFAFLDPEITEERLQLAIAQFVKSIVSVDSRWDDGRAQVQNQNADFPNFTADENAGKTLFMTGRNQGGAHCGTCHVPPEFNILDNLNGHNGIVGEASDPLSSDLTVTRSPSLRDVFALDTSLNGPLMHDGSLTTAEAMIAHYNNIPVPLNEPERSNFLATIDTRLRSPGMNGTPVPLGLSAAEQAQLVSFLKTLTGESVYSDEKWSDPF